MNKSPALEKRADRAISCEKSLASTESSLKKAVPDGARVEQLEDRVLYSADPFGLSVDTHEFLDDNHVSQLELPGSYNQAPVDLANTAVPASMVNKGLERSANAETLIHDDIASHLDSSDLNLFNENFSSDQTQGDFLANSDIVTDKAADQYEGRRTVLVDGVNDAPSMSDFPTTDPVFTELGPSVLIGPSLLVVDPDLDLDTYNKLEITLQRSGGADESDIFDLGSHAQGEDIVDAGGSGAIIGTILQNDTGTLHLRFNASADFSAVSDTVQSIAYSNSALTDTAAQVDLEWILDDNNSGTQGSGGPLSASYISTVDIVPSFFLATDDNVGDVVSGTPLSISSTLLLSNDTGLNASTATIIGHTDPSQGQVTNTGSALEYSSSSSASGVVSFDYTAMSGNPDLISQWQLAADAVDDTSRNSGLVVSDSVANDLVFDGDDYVEIPLYDYPSEFTLTFDFKINDLGHNIEETLFSQGDWQTPNSLFVWVNGTSYGTESQAGMLMTNLWDSNDTQAGYSGYQTDVSGFANDGNWHNYAVVLREGSDPDNSGVLIYIDGILQNTSSNLRGTDPFEPTAPAYIGVDNNSVVGLDHYLTNHEVANLQLLNGYDSAALESGLLNELNEFSTASVLLDFRSEELLVHNELLVVAEDQSESVSDSWLLTTDSDENPIDLIYTIDDAADFGFLVLDGVDLNLGDSFTQQDINDGKLQYRHAGNEVATTDATVLRVDDGAGSDTTFTFNIEIQSVNDSPLLGSLESSNLIYIEGVGNVGLTNSLTVSDVDSVNLISATVSVSENYNSSEDTLSFTAAAGITGNFDSPTGVLTLSGFADKDDWQSVLRSVGYQNISDNPDLQTRTVSFVINDGSNNSTMVSRDIRIGSVNDSPDLADGELTSIIQNTLSPSGDTIDNIFSGQFTDIDGEFAGIVIADDAASGEGTWQYSTDSGNNWFDVLSVSKGSGLALDVSSLLRFLPATDYTGTVPEITVLGIDDSYTDLFTNGAARETVNAANSTVGDFLSSSSAVVVSEVVPSGPVDLSSGIALNVDGGNNSYLILNDGGVGLGVVDEFTIESQFSIETVTEYSSLLSYAAENSTNEFRYGVLDTGHLLAYIDGDRVRSDTAYPELLDGNIHSVAVSWNSSNGDTQFYIDGVLAYSTSGIALGEQLRSGGALVIGQEQDIVAGGFDPEQALQGVIYDVRIWSEERTPGEIAKYSQVKLDSADLPDSLVANWQMDGFNSAGEVEDVVSGRNFTVGNTSEAGFVGSTPIGVFQINENALADTVVGRLVPTLPNTDTNLVGDGAFSANSESGAHRYSVGTVVGGADGSWLVDSGNVDDLGNSTETPQDGEALDLNGLQAGSISQTLITEPGKTYQLDFALTADFNSSTTKALQVSAGSTTNDFSISGSSADSMVWETRSMTFEATSISTVLSFSSLNASGDNGAIIGDVQVAEVAPVDSSTAATDSSFYYDAVTGKSYLLVTDGLSWFDAQAAAASQTINGSPGQLVTIGSAYENEVIRQLSELAGSRVWIGASDQSIETQWHWQSGDSDGYQFWSGDDDGDAVNGAYSNWSNNEPNNFISENYALMDTNDGEWNDRFGASSYNYVIEWDINSSSSIAQYSLQSNPSGIFAIDSDTGELTAPNSASLDYESATSHDVVVRVTDVDGAAYDETFNVEVIDVPAPALSNVELAPLSYFENDGPVNVSTTLQLTTDQFYMADSATIRIGSGYVAGEDMLSFSGDSLFTSIWDIATGTLDIIGTDSDANWQDALRSVTFENISNDPLAGDRSIEFSVTNESEESPLATRVVSVVSVNDAPVASDLTVTLPEDTSYSLQTDDFGFSDVIDNHQLAAIHVVSAPHHGELQLSGIVVVDNQVIPATEVTAGNLVFVPEDNVSGDSYDNISFRLQDDGGTNDGGDDLSDAVANIIFDVTEVSDSPKLLANDISLYRGGSILISAADVEAIDWDVPAAQRIITLITTPSFGTLQLNGLPVAASGSVTYADILADKVTYVHNGVGTSHDSIMLSLADAGATASGSVTASISVIVKETHPQLLANTAIVVEGLSVSIPVLENDFVADQPFVPASVTIVSAPKHGSTSIDAAGNVTYLHDGSESLQDSFSYTVEDTGGDVSDAAIVSITVSAVNDLPVLAGYNSAVFMAVEDSTVALSLSDLQAASTDAEDRLLSGLVVQSIDSGKLTLGATQASSVDFQIGVNDTIDAATNAYWTPAENAIGTLSAFTVSGLDSDGALSASSETVKATVSEVNDPPVLAGYGSAIITGVEDTSIEISLADLRAASTDVEDGVLHSLVVERIDSGQLTLGATQATAVDFQTGVNDTIDAANNAYWTPANNANGTLSAFTVSGLDSDGALSASSETVIATVSEFNDLPVLAGYGSAILSGVEDSLLTITLGDLQASSVDVEDGQLTGLVVKNVDSGQLTIGATPATAVDFQKNVHNTIDASNNAYWIPAENANGTLSAFTVNGLDSTGALSASSETVLATVSEVNDRPVLAGYGSPILSAIEDTQLTISLADLQAQSTDIEDGVLTGIVVQSVDSGQLSIGATPATAVDFQKDIHNIIDAANNAYWTPAENANGTLNAFTVSGLDADATLSASSESVSATVTEINDPPVLAGYSGSILSGTEDTSLTITIADLQAGSTDVEDGLLHSLVVQSVDSGRLTIGATEATAVEFVKDVHNTIDVNNNAYWTPDPHVNGSSLAAFTGRGQDSDNGVSAALASILVDITAVNDAPIAIDSSIEFSSDNFYQFKQIDFGFSDLVEGDQLQAVQITSLPDSGQLLYRGAVVTPGLEVPVDEIALGYLQYKAQAGVAEDLISTQFGFSVRDDGGSMNGDSDLSVVSAILTLAVENTDEFPVVFINGLQVAENTLAGMVVGQIQATDPDPVTTHLSDGGFKAVDRVSGNHSRYSSDGSNLGDSIGSWQVVSGAVDLRGEEWTVGPEGGFLLDLNADESGAIEQVIETVPGARYNLVFWVGGHFGDTSGTNGIVELEVSAGGLISEFSIEEPEGWSKQNLSMQQQSVTFTALEDNTTIAFRSLTPGAYGAIVTDISVQDALSYELLSADVPFTMELDGTILVAENSLDHETQDSYSLSINVSEPDGKSVTTSVPLAVTDVNEVPGIQVTESVIATISVPHIIDYSYLAAFDQDDTDSAPDALTYKLVSLPNNGVLKLDGNELLNADTFSQQDINQQRLTYTAVTPGADTFTFHVEDGKEDGVTYTEASLLIENYEPLQLSTPVNWTINEGAVVTVDDTLINFSGGYTDPQSIRVDVLSQPSSLEIRNQQSGLITTQFTMQQIIDGQISVSHDGGEPVSELLQLELYRTDTDQPTLVDSETMNILVADVADAPSGADSVMETDHASSLVITTDQLGFYDNNDADELQGIVIVKLPDSGILYQQNIPVQAGALISLATLQANELRFEPDPLTVGIVTETIEFKIIDSGDTNNGGTNEAQQTNTISVTITSDHSPQPVDDRVLVDEGGLISSFVAGDESVLSNDSDLDTPIAELLVQVVEEPLHGVLQLNQDGTFEYRHDGSETTTDSFIYRVVDANAEFDEDAANVAQVNIEITPQNDNPEAGEVGNHILVTDEPFQIQLPADLFTDAESPDDLALSASLSNGSALPDWLSFDPETGEFSGSPDSQFAVELEVVVAATDSAGATAQTSFVVTLEPKIAAAVVIEDDLELFVEVEPTPEAPVETEVNEVEGAEEFRETIVSFAGETIPDAKTETGDLSQLVIAGVDNNTDNEPVVTEFDDKVIKHNKADSFVVNSISPFIELDDAKLSDLFLIDSGFEFAASERVLGDLNRNLDELDSISDRQVLVVGSTVSMTAGVSIGYLVVLARGGLLLGSVMSSMPAWRSFDPVPVLQNFNEDDDEQDESLETIVNNQNAETEGEGDEKQKSNEPDSAESDADAEDQEPSKKDS